MPQKLLALAQKLLGGSACDGLSNAHRSAPSFLGGGRYV